MKLNTFKGKNGLLSYLTPRAKSYLPLVELPDCLNPFMKDKVRIFAKLMNALPLSNVKSLPAYFMLHDALRTNKLSKVHSLIENSSGNTVLSLTVFGKLLGIPKTHAIASHEVSKGKLDLLRFFGTHIHINKEPICPDPSDRTSGIHIARKKGKQKGWYNPGQYDNESNPRAHECVTGHQVWQQTQGKMCVFCAGLGTTGTLVGSAKYLKRMSEDIQIVGVTRKPNNPVPGVRTKNLLQEIAFDWGACVDHLEEIATLQSYAQSLSLCRHGLLVGPSSGFSFAGLLAYLRKEKKRGRLQQLRNKDGEILAVFICPDSPFPYISEYFKYLPKKYFPKAHGENLLQQNTEIQEEPCDQSNFQELPEVSCQDAFKMIFKKSVRSLRQDITNGRSIAAYASVLDIRSRVEFEQFHIPTSEQIAYQDIFSDFVNRESDQNGTIIIVCPRGERSLTIARELKKRGFKNAFSLKEGMLKWSALDYPRVLSNVCVSYARNKK